MLISFALLAANVKKVSVTQDMAIILLHSTRIVSVVGGRLSEFATIWPDCEVIESLGVPTDFRMTPSSHSMPREDDSVAVGD